MLSEDQKRKQLQAIFITVLVDLMGVCIVIPIAAPLILGNSAGVLPEGLAMNTKTLILGALLSAFPIAQFFGAPILGSMSDKFGRKKVLTFSILGSVIGYLIFALGIYFKSIELLFFSRVLDGFTGGNISVVQASMADFTKPEERAKNFGMIGMAFGIGMVVGPVIGGLLSNPDLLPWFSFQIPYLFAAILCMMNFLLIQNNFNETLFTFTDTKINAFTGFKNIKEGFSHPTLKWLFAISFFYALGFNFYTQFFQVFLFKKYGMMQTQIGYYFTWVGICIAFCQGLVVRKVAAKFAGEKILQVSMLLTAASLVINLLVTQSWMIFLLTPFTALGQGLSYPNIGALISKNAIDGQQGKTLGIQHSVFAASLAIPPFCAALLDNVHLYLPISMAAFSIFIGWCILMRWNAKFKM
jgi:MFS transporter, DHA1 family, tetracycline resistance protein